MLARNDYRYISIWRFFGCFLMIFVTVTQGGRLHRAYCLQVFAAWGTVAGYVQTNVKMDIMFALLWLLAVLFEGVLCQGVYGKSNIHTTCISLYTGIVTLWKCTRYMVGCGFTFWMMSSAIRPMCSSHVKWQFLRYRCTVGIQSVVTSCFMHV